MIRQLGADAVVSAYGSPASACFREALVTAANAASKPVIGIDIGGTGIKGATASNQVKPATLETGLVVNVPPFVNSGDTIRVSTESGEYLSRA